MLVMCDDGDVGCPECEMLGKDVGDVGCWGM